MKLGNKILATVLVVVLVGVISQVLVQQKVNLANTSITQEQRWTGRAIQGLELKANSEHQNSALAEYVLIGQAEQLNHFLELSNETKKQMEQFIQDTQRDEVKQHLQKVLQNQEKLIEVFNREIRPAVEAGDLALVGRIYTEKFTPLSEAIEADLEKFVEDRKQEVIQQQEIVANASKQAVQYGVIFTVLAAILGITISFVMSRQIINPLKKLIQRAEALAEGDLTQTMDHLHQKDEIGDLARAFQKMEDELKRVISLIIADSMTLAAHSQQMSAASQEVSANVHGIAGLTTELAATAENQAANAMGASAVSREAEEVAREGGRAVQDVINKMESIRSTVNNSTQVMAKLSEQSKQIGQIIAAITGIADQTNLLALNAAIEAARAGEHGKGFAVVAEEVRNLAEKSATAAKEISSIVSEIRQDIEQAVEAMEIGAKEVNEGVLVVEKAGQSLEQIVEKVVNSSQYISEISVATEQTSDATQELAQSTDQVNSAVEQIAQSSVSLAKMAQEFSELTSHFKVLQEKQGDFWEGKVHCSETKNCLAEGRDPSQCKVSKYPGYPCWNLKGTHCKGEKGNDIRQCKECEVYKQYGNGQPIVVYDDNLLESNSGIDWD
ncbi:methyl-accepting chemotaxis protein [Desulforamulus ferrireducens]|uniref:Methyl-accepting chemotaxis sensory transducer n=1 Tax=Desulforamulus ferrireducens TaxID=1833852 RepID=A0A1S6IYU2_9FIRM|nr:methyl-accepting chemotaxis protein [Desulforamulus ferrireducens]AQS59944.1 hypothetical protein B0537_13175 [Desulforamulus ferrireducens]